MIVWNFFLKIMISPIWRDFCSKALHDSWYASCKFQEHCWNVIICICQKATFISSENSSNLRLMHICNGSNYCNCISEVLKIFLDISNNENYTISKTTHFSQSTCSGSIFLFIKVGICLRIFHGSSCTYLVGNYV